MARKKVAQQKKGAPNSASVLPNKNNRPDGSEVNLTKQEVDFIEKNSGVAAPHVMNNEDLAEAEKRSNQTSRISPKRKKQVEDAMLAGGHTVPDIENTERKTSTAEPAQSSEGDHMSSNSYSQSSVDGSLNGSHVRHDTAENMELSYILVFMYLRSLALSLFKGFSQWLERLEPIFETTKHIASNAIRHVRLKVENAYPVMVNWSMNVVKVMLLVLMVWLECSIRGLDSFLHMGTTSFFSVIWCSALSIIAMIGIFKFLITLAVVAVVGLFLGFALAILLTSIAGMALIWFYGSFWITMLVVFSGGLAFLLKRERLALFIATSYSVYCAWGYVGWIGLFVGLNLSFVSSEVLIFLLRDKINEQTRTTGPAEQIFGSQGQPNVFPNEQTHASTGETGGYGIPAHRGTGIASTSGSDSETTSEDEVLRLLTCNDNYAALGLSRFQDVDISILKREYRKKAMLVHPDKNMSNPKAAEAFQKLQNAYEVLLDNSKRKTYDDELRREELLSYFRRFQEASQPNGRHGFFSSGIAREDAGDEESLLESRRIACRKCGNFHIWVYTKKMKSRARWCQECKDYHPAKDGDGWVEQLSHPIAFGILQKTDPPAAYICANSKIYNATEWYICQGMRCAANTHKPSFHVNTNVTGKPSNGRGAGGGQRAGGMGTPNPDEKMTEEEFFEWFQNVVQSGMFDSFVNGHSDAQSGGTGSTSKNGGGTSGSSNNPKRKKKGKR